LQDFRKPDWKKWLEFTAEEFDDYAERNTGKFRYPNRTKKLFGFSGKF
jgi:hypothetical protein